MTPEKFKSSLEEVSKSSRKAGYMECCADILGRINDRYETLINTEQPYLVVLAISELITQIGERKV